MSSVHLFSDRKAVLLLIYIAYTSFVVSEVTTIYGESNCTMPHNAMDKQSNLCSSDRRCICYNDTENHTIADCSSKNITYVPLFDKSVSVIYLQHNYIKNIHNTSYMCGFPKQLLYLDLSHNTLCNLSGNPFVNLTQLRNLNMSNNNLSYIEDIYPPALFEDLKNLTHLDIQANNKSLLNLNLSYPLAIAKLERLESLYLDGIDEGGFPTPFRSLKMLKTISMNGNTGVCNLTNIHEHFFINTPQLTNITLSNCSTRSIEKGAFINLNNLTYLNISSNFRLTFKVLANFTSELQNTSIATLDISRLHCDFGTGTMLFKEDLVGLKSTKLKELYSENNRLVNAEQGVIELLPSSLDFVSLRGNRLSFGCYLFSLFQLPIKVFLADNQYPSHMYNHFKNIDCGDWRAPTSQMGRDPACSFFYNRNVKLGNLPFPPFPVPRYLEKISFDNSVLNNEIPPISLTTTRLTYASVKHNYFYSWVGPVGGLGKLETLDLSFNFCKYVSNEFFSYLNNLKSLYIGNNPLGGILNADYKGLIFGNLSKLEHLDLSSMKIKGLPSHILHNQAKLQMLNLSGNEIVNFTLSFSHMRNMRTLDLSDNRILTLSHDTTKQIDNIKHIKINLTDNTLVCSCGYIDFIEWLNINQGKFHNFEANTCSFQGTNTSFTDFNELLTDLKRSCANHTLLIAALTACIAVSIAIIAVGLVYRYRWKLRYLYYMSKSKSRGYIPLGENDDDYIYDAFVSYSETEGAFVRSELLEKLEKNHHLKLCLHQRDFLPGNAIADNITEAINKSRKTIIILSKGYLKSKWCSFEYNMARMESLYSRSGEDLVVVVMFERVPVNDLSSHMLEHIESDSYLEYTTDEQGQVVFWNNLYRSCVNLH